MQRRVFTVGHAVLFYGDVKRLRADGESLYLAVSDVAEQAVGNGANAVRSNFLGNYARPFVTAFGFELVSHGIEYCRGFVFKILSVLETQGGVPFYNGALYRAQANDRCYGKNTQTDNKDKMAKNKFLRFDHLVYSLFVTVVSHTDFTSFTA